MSRTRSIKRHPQNGGKECAELHQKRGCHGQKCEIRNTAKTSRGECNQGIFYSHLDDNNNECIQIMDA